MTTDIKATKTGSTFRMECAVDCVIRAKPERIWALLTDAAGFSKWNSTVTSIEGPIALGQRLALKVPAAPDRVFRPSVTRFDAPDTMVWSDGMAPMFKGVRTYTLTAGGEGTTRFSMREEFSGVMLPLIKGSLPDFVPIFEKYAEDLKREAERSA